MVLKNGNEKLTWSDYIEFLLNKYDNCLNSACMTNRGAFTSVIFPKNIEIAFVCRRCFCWISAISARVVQTSLSIDALFIGFCSRNAVYITSPNLSEPGYICKVSERF